MFNTNISSIRIYRTVKKSDGLVGFASCILDDKYFLNGIGIYEKLNGGHRITFPKRKDSHGVSKDIFFPIDQDVNIKITKEIIKAYDKDILTLY